MKNYLLLVAVWLLVGFRPALGADNNGAIDEDPPVIDIALTPNRSSTTADFLVYDGEPLSFDGSGSYDPDGGALTKHDWTINYTSGKPKDYAGIVFDTSYALANGSMQTMRLLIRDNENNYVSKTVTIEVVAAPVVEWERTYFIRDHLGSVRVAFNEEGDVVEATDYYPFGLQMPTRSFVAGPGVKENFTGHELDAGIGLLYAGARYLDPATGRWLTVDPLRAEFPAWSSYNYGLDNPASHVDLDGRSSTHVDELGNVAAVYNDGDRGVYRHSDSAEEIASRTANCQSARDTACGGETIGRTLHPESFNVGQTIDFGSDYGGALIDRYMSRAQSMTVAGYALRAVDRGSMDVKRHETRGGFVASDPGLVVSPRDVGNIVAGSVAGRPGVPTGHILAAYGNFNSIQSMFGRSVDAVLAIGVALAAKPEQLMPMFLNEDTVTISGILYGLSKY